MSRPILNIVDERVVLTLTVQDGAAAAAKASEVQTGLDRIATGEDVTAAESAAAAAEVAKIEWQGDWVAGTYQIHDAVAYLGSSWIANKTTAEVPSLAAVDWDLLAERGTDGDVLPVGAENDLLQANGAGVFEPIKKSIVRGDRSYIPNTYFGNGGNTTINMFFSKAGLNHGVYIDIFGDISISEFVFQQLSNTTGRTGNIKCGLYKITNNVATLISDLGSFSIDTNSVKTLSFTPISIERGFYAIIFIPDTDITGDDSSFIIGMRGANPAENLNMSSTLGNNAFPRFNNFNTLGVFLPTFTLSNLGLFANGTLAYNIRVS